jgi:salicylate hydroxylase
MLYLNLQIKFTSLPPIVLRKLSRKESKSSRRIGRCRPCQHTTPHQGAGAGQAIEDAFILSNLLGKVDSVAGIEKAFQAYDAARRPRSQKVVATSRDAAAIYEFEDEKLGTDLELIKETLETRYDWIWDEDLHQQLKKAHEIAGGQKASL